jgi:hypothetical protein
VTNPDSIKAVAEGTVPSQTSRIQFRCTQADTGAGNVTPHLVVVDLAANIPRASSEGVDRYKETDTQKECTFGSVLTIIIRTKPGRNLLQNIWGSLSSPRRYSKSCGIDHFSKNNMVFPCSP